MVCNGRTHWSLHDDFRKGYGRSDKHIYDTLFTHQTWLWANAFIKMSPSWVGDHYRAQQGNFIGSEKSTQVVRMYIAAITLILHQDTLGWWTSRKLLSAQRWMRASTTTVGVWSMGLPTYRSYIVGMDHYDTTAHDVLQFRLLGERLSSAHMQLHGQDILLWGHRMNHHRD